MTPSGEARRTPLWRRIDWTLLAAAAGLLVYGVLFVRSACAVRTGAVQLLWLKMQQTHRPSAGC